MLLKRIAIFVHCLYVYFFLPSVSICLSIAGLSESVESRNPLAMSMYIKVVSDDESLWTLMRKGQE